ncbi:MAG: TonB-dependent receptor [Woeseia sp.]
MPRRSHPASRKPSRLLDGAQSSRVAAPVRSAVATAVGLALSSGFAAAAQNDENREALDEVVVEGQMYDNELRSPKFTAPLLDTPKSVTVIPAALAAEQGATSLVEALKNVPGVTFNAGEGGQPAGDNLKIRGFDAGADVFIDGVRDGGSQTRDIFALEQIEVTKGPGSAYSGRGATGGSVNLVTKEAGTENFFQSSLGGGTDEYMRATVDANHRFSDSVALRLNLLGHQGDIPGRNEVFIDHRGIAPSLAIGLGRPTRLNLDYYHYRTDDMPDYSIPYGRNADNSAPEGPPVDVESDNFYGLLNRDFQKTGADIGTLRIEHDFSDSLSLRNTTRYGDTSNDYIVTNPDDGRANVPEGFVLRNAKSRNSTTTTKANVTDLIGRFDVGDTSHSFIAGVEFSNERMYNRNYAVESLFGENAVTDFANSCSAPGAVGAPSNFNCTTLDNPDPHDPWTGAIVASDSATIAETDTTSVYAFDTITFTERWSLNLGLRYDDYRTEQLSGEIVAPIALSNDTDFWNHQVGVVFKPAANGSIYLATGTSSNPSGNTLGDGSENLGENNVDLEPERNRNYELGTKWELLESRLSLSSAVFHTEKTNARVAIEPGRGGLQQTIGEQEVDGFEIGVAGQLGERWQLQASYTRLDSEIVDDGPINADEGNDFPNTPTDSANLWTTYALLENFSIGAGATYVGRRYGNTANTVWAPSYVLYDAMASLEVGERYKLQLNLQNLADEVYYVRPYSNHYAAMGAGRSAVLTASVEF